MHWLFDSVGVTKVIITYSSSVKDPSTFDFINIAFIGQKWDKVISEINPS